VDGEVAAAIESFGTMFARGVVRHLALHGASTTGEIAEALGTDANTARRRLVQLEAAGLVVADTAAGERSGRRVRYDLDRDRVQTLVDALREYLLGG
jgi:predicted ArsR family transcriptional regulator